MQTIKTVRGQSIFDLAIQEYGNIEAAFMIIEDNNLYTIDVADSLPEGMEVKIRETDDTIRQNVLKKLDGEKVISE
ncbi:hypothetical protein [Persicobacter sp. CCB-QB2]|uniref:hypothetical protein n=1 Tax=Persicobacter sp. CCB-QB2 TaxID=1561025 RepID=UPI0006A9F521|nr:hypothetical protein [Persicobacter sp. CCB-QB2]